MVHACSILSPIPPALLAGALVLATVTLVYRCEGRKTNVLFRSLLRRK
jgi:hypothetical protein